MFKEEIGWRGFIIYCSAATYYWLCGEERMLISLGDLFCWAKKTMRKSLLLCRNEELMKT